MDSRAAIRTGTLCPNSGFFFEAMMQEGVKRSLQQIKRISARVVLQADLLKNIGSIASQKSLMEMTSHQLKGRQLILASNREPYTHVAEGDAITWFRSAGGLTIALDSVAQACSALWVCHGGTQADFKVADAQGRVGVPPDNPRYQLKRIALSKEEEQGYYEGFSNEALWPLSHVCYVRPAFREQDWLMYQQVNHKFAQAIAEEAQPGALVFLQDYHLCLVSQYLKEKRPDLTTVLFWHIPWPNPEIFRICPWKQEILKGLLANDILGFHINYHATNFIETVNTELECHTDIERRIITQGERRTRVRAYPISVDLQAIYNQSRLPGFLQASIDLRQKHRLEGVKVGLGVDRLDYTKGIPERLDALDLLFQRHPEHLNKFTYVQIGVPSRMHIEDYRQVVHRIEDRCAEINRRYGNDDWQPVILLKSHHDFNALLPWYKLADVCLVSSLHDGMNLVAKEFIAASEDGRGVLVLSRFTGAWRELEQALPVNPYDAARTAETYHQALVMPLEEQGVRLERMRRQVGANNIYTWAQAILGDVIQLADDQKLAGA
jgi:alpha,alpha-trehalose-phosphate synthase [UDP-forming]